jgi:[glutamine synthetase] adenylyltransferase / [glutamine synthetase]-adenylyl-L-tyrosine phosphorylase
VAEANESVEQLLRELPDPRAARLLFDRLTKQKSIQTLFQRNPALLSDVLTLAAWSPLLATTLENDPDYVTWLQRERKDTRVQTREELGESLGRFALTNSQLDPHVMLSRFRRRELLRTYLHDIRRARTVVETTEELSNLADAILEYALKLARQELDNRYGAPQVVDAQQRISTAEFCVVALGKLGSSELNYASDIDLIFLFSDDGQTAVGGARGQITNREYFVKLSERLLRVVSEPIGEGASYRIDVRLRPYGREGALACSLDEAVAYYERSAQDWELQALIRSRAAAGSIALYPRFARRVSHRVFRRDISVSDALRNVRLAKQKIDVQREREQKGLNVKLGRGGIREIEFIAQALQIAFGGRDPWLRAPHTLVSLGRLADRELITEREHWQLSDAYHFLRALEHRLQMEHGLQTHSVPTDAVKRELVARRMNFSGEQALAEFETALNTHTGNVLAAFERVFGVEGSSIASEVPAARPATIDDAQSQMPLEFAAHVLAKHGNSSDDARRVESIAELLSEEAATSLNPPRAISHLTRFAASLDKESEPLLVSDCEIRRLVQLCGVSEFFGEMIASRPSLVHVLSGDEQHVSFELTSAVEHQETFADELDALRRAWSRGFVRIGAQDCQGRLTIAQANSLLSRLAVDSIEASLLIARRQLERRYQKLSALPRLAVLGLGRLGSGGMDYGSDLDVIIVYDSSAPSPIANLTNEEVYARLTEFFVTALSSITGEGYLYRVDLRLRPDGQKGALATGSQSFMNYLQERAGIWEWLAYVKLRAVAGDLEFARSIESAARRSVHDLARQADARALRDEACRVRDRLEKERGHVRGAGFNIKHGAGGMLDVYFATRYLQLRDNVPDDDEDRTTLRTLERLRDAGSLADGDFAAMSEGYQLLRAVDHQLRLIVGRAARLPAPEQPAFSDIARRLNFDAADELSKQLDTCMQAIRGAYERIMKSEK